MMKFMVAFLAPILFGIFFNLKPNRFLISGVTGVFAWAGYLMGEELTGSSVFATFLGALFVGLLSEAFARVFKHPSLVIAITGSIPLVPGLSAYRTADNYIKNEFYESAKYMGITLGSAGAIAVGLMLGTAILTNIYDMKRIRKLREEQSPESDILADDTPINLGEIEVDENL